MKTFIGIDNGHTGAIAVLTSEGHVRAVWDTPVLKYGKETRIDEKTFWDILFPFCGADTFVTFEAGQKQPAFGTKGNFTNGVSHGTVRTLVALLSVGYQEVDPATWQRPILRAIRGAGQDTKGASLEFCRRTWPDVNLEGKDGRADALCMAEFGRRTKAGAVAVGGEVEGRTKRRVAT